MAGFACAGIGAEVSSLYLPFPAPRLCWPDLSTMSLNLKSLLTDRLADRSNMSIEARLVPRE
jgi:hypothetical protein